MKSCHVPQTFFFRWGKAALGPLGEAVAGNLVLLFRSRGRLTFVRSDSWYHLQKTQFSHLKNQWGPLVGVGGADGFLRFFPALKIHDSGPVGISLAMWDYLVLGQSTPHISRAQESVKYWSAMSRTKEAFNEHLLEDRCHLEVYSIWRWTKCTQIRPHASFGIVGETRVNTPMNDSDLWKVLSVSQSIRRKNLEPMWRWGIVSAFLGLL